MKKNLSLLYLAFLLLFTSAHASATPYTFKMGSDSRIDVTHLDNGLIMSTTLHQGLSSQIFQLEEGDSYTFLYGQFHTVKSHMMKGHQDDQSVTAYLDFNMPGFDASISGNTFKSKGGCGSTHGDSEDSHEEGAGGSGGSGDSHEEGAGGSGGSGDSHEEGAGGSGGSGDSHEEGVAESGGSHEEGGAKSGGSGGSHEEGGGCSGGSSAKQHWYIAWDENPDSVDFGNGGSFTIQLTTGAFKKNKKQGKDHTAELFNDPLALIAATSEEDHGKGGGSCGNPHYADIFATVTLNTAPVPEPATFLLLGTGLVGFAGARKKKRNLKS